MNLIVLGVVALVLIAAHHAYFIKYALTHQHEWIERRIHAGTFGYTKTLVTSTIVSALFAGFAFFWRAPGDPTFLNGILIPYAVAAVVWISVFSSFTDINSLKVPMDIAVRGYLAVFPVPVIALFFVQDWVFTLISVVLFLLWAAFLYFFFGRGFGQADVRLLILYACGLTWWVGIDWTFYAFLIACVAQLVIFHPLAGVFKIGKIRAPGQRYNPNIDVLPPDMDLYSDESELGSKIPKKRGFVPLVPALSTTYLVLIVVSLVMSRTSCSAYDGIFCSM